MNSSGGSDSESVVFDYHDDDSSIRPRKRQRLTHLSPGEKLQRRKLKNRVAAQAARDRKKAYMDELEELVADLRKENDRLAHENLVLRERQQLSCVNCQNSTPSSSQRLANKLEGGSVAPIDVNSVKTEASMPSFISTLTEPVSGNSKSAVLSPQQKEQMQALLVLMMTSCSLICHKNCSNSAITSSKMQEEQPLDLTTRQNCQAVAQDPLTSFRPQWWGPQQSSWNPSKTMMQ